MNTRFYSFYSILCFFPVWVFRSNLNLFDLIVCFFTFGILPFLFCYLVIRKCSNKLNFWFIIWLSLSSFYCIDQNIGLWSIYKHGFYSLELSSPYFTSLFYSVLTILIFSIFFIFTKDNGIKICFSFLFVIFVFNLLDTNKYYSNFPKVNQLKNNQTSKEANVKKIILIFDEMSGMNSIDSSVDNGEETNKYLKNFFNKFNFKIYINSYALFRDTDKSLGSLLNFVETNEEYSNLNTNKDIHFMKKSDNFFTVNTLTSNKFFDLEYNKNIVVTQSMYINFCDHPKVIICNQFDPYKKELKFLEGFKDTKLSRFISFYRNNGSVTSFFIWRLLLEFRVIDTLLDPAGEKASIEYIFQNLIDDIEKYKQSNLFFSHILVPHIPFAFDDECNFNGNKSINYNRISIKEKRIQHNLEKKCLIDFLGEFFNKLRLKDSFDKFEILIFSDHDSRIVNSKNILNNVIYAHKEINSESYKEAKGKFSINYLFNSLYSKKN